MSRSKSTGLSGTTSASSRQTSGKIWCTRSLEDKLSSLAQDPPSTGAWDNISDASPVVTKVARSGPSKFCLCKRNS